ncbi:MAG: hypothetical protein ACE5GT_02920 [Rhodospirillales bacterium]
MAKTPQPPASNPAPGGGTAGAAQFFAPDEGGYRRSQDGGPGAGMPPPPQQVAPSPPPQAAPPPAEPIDMSSPQDAGKVIADTVMRGFVDRLKAEAHAKGGRLTVADLEEMQAEFDRQAEALSGVFQQSFEVYVKARERSVWDAQRNYPFDRVMVKRFSHLFNEGDELGADDLCRRMLPGFFVALGMMLGPDVVEEYQEKVRGAVDRVKSGGKSVFNWDDVYEDNVTKAVALDAEVAIAAHFDEFEKRSDWFINMVNNHLPPPEPGMPPSLAEWEMNMGGFHQFLGAFLTDIRAALETDAGKMKFTQRYGAETCANLFDILKRVD